MDYRLTGKIKLTAYATDLERPIVSDQEVPVWAQELIREVTILNERLPNHIDYTQRNITDHEARIRTLEAFRWLLLGVASVSGLIGAWVTKLLGL